MRMVSWNVNGIRACWGNGLEQFLLKEQPDILTLQEVKSQHDSLPAEIVAPPGYSTLWHSGGRPGYSGVGAYLRKGTVQPLWILKGMGVPDIDSEGRCLTMEFETFFLVSAYFPNSGSRGRREPYKKEFCRLMRVFCDNLRARGKGVLLTGDYNIAPYDIDLFNPQAVSGQAGTLESEISWMRSMLEEGWIDLVRRDREGETGHYSWWSFFDQDRDHNRGWRIDHALASPDLATTMTARLRPDIYGSDHCPLEVVWKPE